MYIICYFLFTFEGNNTNYFLDVYLLLFVSLVVINGNFFKELMIIILFVK